MNRIRLYVLSIFMCLSTASLMAQKWEAGLQVGTAGYMGDLSPNHPFQTLRYNVGVSGSYYFNGTWAARATLNYAHLKGDDSKSANLFQQERNFAFDNKIIGLSGLVDFHFFEFLPQRSKSVYSPYVFSGISIFYSDPTYPITQFEQFDNYTIVNKEFPSFNWGIPVGAGFKYNLKSKWSVGAEVSHRIVFSDYLDGVGAYTYMPNDPTFPKFEKQFGDSHKRDGFMTINLTVSYMLYKGRCPQWR